MRRLHAFFKNSKLCNSSRSDKNFPTNEALTKDEKVTKNDNYLVYAITWLPTPSSYPKIVLLLVHFNISCTCSSTCFTLALMCFARDFYMLCTCISMLCTCLSVCLTPPNVCFYHPKDLKKQKKNKTNLSNSRSWEGCEYITIIFLSQDILMPVYEKLTFSTLNQMECEKTSWNG